MSSVLDPYKEHASQLMDLRWKALQYINQLDRLLSEKEAEDLTEILLDQGIYLSIQHLILSMSVRRFKQFPQQKGLLMRHYKKHKLDFQKSFESLVNHIEWRLQNGMSNFNVDSVPPLALSLFDKGFSSYIGGRDLLERPLLFIRLNQIAGVSVEILASHLMLVAELGRRLILLTSTAAETTPVFQLAVIVDLDGFGFTHFVSSLSLYASNKYPHSMAHIRIMNFCRRYMTCSVVSIHSFSARSMFLTMDGSMLESGTL
jgi:hypothetical protein